jgi:hypothetical protein
LTALAVIAIVLGSFGVLGGLQRVAGLVLQPALSQMGRIRDNPNASPQMQQQVARQRAMQDDMQRVQRSWNPVMWVIAPTSIVFCTCLIIGGALCIKLSRTGRKLLVGTCIAGLAFDMGRGAADVLMTMQISRVMQDHMASITGGDPGAEMATGVMSATMGMGLAFAGAWVVLKVAYHLWVVIYLTRRPIEDLFERGIGI